MIYILDFFFSFLKRLSSIKIVLFFLIIFIIIELVFTFFFIPIFGEITNGENIIDMKVFYNPDSIKDSISNYGKDGIEFYRKIQLLDLLFPIIYAFTFSLAIIRIVKPFPNQLKWFQYFALLPFIAALFDYLENLNISLILNQYPNNISNLIKITNIYSIIKFSAFGFSIIMTVFLLSFAIIRANFNQS